MLGFPDSRVGVGAGRPGRRRRLGCSGALAAVAAIAAVVIPAATAADPPQYQQTNLISDIPGVARITDPNLVNPWGQAASPTSPLWVADNGADVSTLYSGGVDGSIPAIVPLVVSIPQGAPTGTVFNSTSDFVVHTPARSGPALFIFDSESGVLSAWAGQIVSGTNAQVEFANTRSVYKGLALASVGSHSFLYAANFSKARIDVFNHRFKRVKFPRGFKDRQIPQGFAPFDIQSLDGRCTSHTPSRTAPSTTTLPGPGTGLSTCMTPAEHLLTRLISHGDLNSPWGLVIAPPSGFGAFSGDLLVGNFGDGAIHAYDPLTGAAKGQLMNTDGNPILINGLWALRFGNGMFGATNSLVFTAGIGDESHGLLGEITAAP